MRVRIKKVKGNVTSYLDESPVECHIFVRQKGCRMSKKCQIKCQNICHIDCQATCQTKWQNVHQISSNGVEITRSKLFGRASKGLKDYVQCTANKM